MDLFNILVSVCGALLAWCVKVQYDTQKEMEKKLANLPNEYARRDDHQNFTAAIFTKLDRIEDKLDRKADK